MSNLSTSSSKPSLSSTVSVSSTPACDLQGIKFTTRNEFVSTLMNVTPENLTNGIAYEIFSQIKQNKCRCNISWTDVKLAVASIYGADPNSWNYMCIRRYFGRVSEHHDRARRVPAGIIEYMARQWKLPPQLERKRLNKQDSDDKLVDGTKVPKFEQFVDQVETITVENLMLENKRLMDKIDVIKQENKVLTDRLNMFSTCSACSMLKEENRKLTDRLVIAQKKIEEHERSNRKFKNEMKLCNRKRMNQMLKRKQVSVVTWCSKYHALKVESKTLPKLKKRNKKLHDALMRFRRAKRKRIERYKAKHQTSHLEYKTVSKNVLEMAKELSNLNEDIRYWQNEATLHQDALKYAKDTNPHFQTKQDGKTYKTEIREASYILQSLGVSQKNVSEAI